MKISDNIAESMHLSFR